jgi:hypothetical protein
MLGEIVGFLAKLTVWAFLVGLALGLFLGLRYAPDSHAVGCSVVCSGVAPAQAATTRGPSG